jgi:hypothetical protein
MRVGSANVAVLALVTVMSGACGGGDGGSVDAGGSTPGGPKILDLATDVAILTEGQSVTFTATVTDADGTGDLVGGTLKRPDGGATYGAFVQTGGGTFTLTVSWEKLHQVSAIEFTADQKRSFRAVFTDVAGHEGFRDVDVQLTCPTDEACAGHCVDLQSDPDNCGTCGHSCAGACTTGICAAAFSRCASAAEASCDAVCTATGGTCVAKGCGGATLRYYSDPVGCNQEDPLTDTTQSCSAALSTDLGFAVRCCCK